MVLDAWVNLFPEGFAESWGTRKENAVVDELFGGDLGAHTIDQLLATMDGAGVDRAVLTTGLQDADRAHRHGAHSAEDMLEVADRHPDRFVVSAVVDRATRPVDNCRRIR